MNAEYQHLAARFYIGTKENKRKSELEGRPIFDEREMIELKIPGDLKNEYHAPANEVSGAREEGGNRRLTYAELFAPQYEAFKRGLEFKGSGTPLAELPFLTEAKRKELQALNVFTAEALASLDGTLLQRLGMDARTWKNKAQAWLDNAAGSAAATRWAGEKEAMQTRMQQLEDMIKDLRDKKAEPTGPVEAVIVDDREPESEPEPNVSPFADWSGEDIKNWYRDNGGKVLRGNFSHAALVAKADALNAEIKAKAQKAAD